MTAIEQYHINQALISELRGLLAQERQILTRQRKTIKKLKALVVTRAGK